MRVVIKPKSGPPEHSGTPSGWPSPTTMSAPPAPHSPGGFKSASEVGLTQAMTKMPRGRLRRRLVVDADMAGFAAEKDTIRGTIRQERARERLSLFMDSVRTKLTADKKLKVNNDLVMKLAQALKRS